MKSSVTQAFCSGPLPGSVQSSSVYDLIESKSSGNMIIRVSVQVVLKRTVVDNDSHFNIGSHLQSELYHQSHSVFIGDNIKVEQTDNQ